MNEKRWVQHISGQGEKWEVMTDNGFQWGLKHPIHSIGWHFVPKSEYHLCDPPEVWRDVTQECEVDSDGIITHFGRTTVPTFGYRRRKVELWQTYGADGKNCPVAAFIVEQKVTA